MEGPTDREREHFEDLGVDAVKSLMAAAGRYSDVPGFDYKFLGHQHPSGTVQRDHCIVWLSEKHKIKRDEIGKDKRRDTRRFIWILLVAVAAFAVASATWVYPDFWKEPDKENHHNLLKD